MTVYTLEISMRWLGVETRGARTVRQVGAGSLTPLLSVAFTTDTLLSNTIVVGSRRAETDAAKVLAKGWGAQQSVLAASDSRQRAWDFSPCAPFNCEFHLMAMVWPRGRMWWRRPGVATLRQS